MTLNSNGSVKTLSVDDSYYFYLSFIFSTS